MKTNLTAKKIAIRNGKGEIKGYLTVYYSKEMGWVSIPAKNE